MKNSGNPQKIHNFSKRMKVEVIESISFELKKLNRLKSFNLATYETFS